MEGLKIRCQTCGLVLYETTSRYTCHKPLTGDMLRLLPLYKDWPTYDGSLAVSSTSRFLMFCSNCAGYIENSVGGLSFADFKEGPRVVSQERSEMSYEDNEVRRTSSGVALPAFPEITLSTFRENRVTVDDPKKAETPTVSPEDLLKEIEKQGNISRPGRSRKKGKRR